MVSSSNSAQSSNTTTEDSRIIADGEGVAVNSDGGNVNLQFVPDEAFELAEMSLETTADAFTKTTDVFSDALAKTQEAAKTEAAQISEQLIKIGIPALALVFLVGSMRK